MLPSVSYVYNSSLILREKKEMRLSKCTADKNIWTKTFKKIEHKPNRHIRSFLLLTLLHMLAQKAYISTSTCQCQQLPVCM